MKVIIDTHTQIPHNKDTKLGYNIQRMKFDYNLAPTKVTISSLGRNGNGNTEGGAERWRGNTDQVGPSWVATNITLTNVR